jgi:TRAP-type C4-dicarboxylate transport system permease small subunit
MPISGAVVVGSFFLSLLVAHLLRSLAPLIIWVKAVSIVVGVAFVLFVIVYAWGSYRWFKRRGKTTSSGTER